MPRKSKAFLARSHASKLGWKRRKRAERAEFTRRSKAAKQGWVTRQRNVRKSKVTLQPTVPNVEWMITIDYTRHGKGFTADLIIIASRSATPTDLANQARKQLPKGKNFLANWFEGSFSLIESNETTSRPLSTKIRSFQRHK